MAWAVGEGEYTYERDLRDATHYQSPPGGVYAKRRKKLRGEIEGCKDAAYCSIGPIAWHIAVI
jgi:hypothetical protein